MIRASEARTDPLIRPHNQLNVLSWKSLLPRVQNSLKGLPFPFTKMQDNGIYFFSPND